MVNTSISLYLSPPRRGTLILFHGLTGTPAEMLPLGEHLHRRGFEVHMPLLSGHGISVENLCRTSVTEWLGDAEEAFAHIVDEHIFLVGMSLGALLALYLGSRYRVDGIISLSAPYLLRRKEHLLTFLSHLPELLLDRLHTVPKVVRPPEEFAFPRDCYPSHSVGAIARLIRLRRSLELAAIRCPALLLQDPDDHHLLPDSLNRLASALSNADVTSQWIPGGGHELTLGKSYQLVFQCIDDFLNRFLSPSHAP